MGQSGDDFSIEKSKLNSRILFENASKFDLSFLSFGIKLPKDVEDNKFPKQIFFSFLI